MAAVTQQHQIYEKIFDQQEKDKSWLLVVKISYFDSFVDRCLGTLLEPWEVLVQGNPLKLKFH